MTTRNTGRFRTLGLSAVAAAALATAMPAMATGAGQGEVNVYSYRQEFLIRPFLDKFTEQTGVKVNVVYVKEGTLERMKAEGENSPADVVLTVDIGRLQAHKDADLLQPIASPVIEKNVPAEYRDPDGSWVGLTRRGRVVYRSVDRVEDGEITSYEQLADPKWQGKICVRAGSHRYNVALVAGMLAALGEDETRAWLKGLVGNFARKPQGNDRAQVKAIKEGQCDLAIGNTYYMAKMATNDKQPEQKEWAASAVIVFPNQDGRGTHMNISGAGVAKHAPNKDNALRLIEFLTEDLSQEMYAQLNYEYPVKPGIALDPLVASWGDFKADTVSLAKIAELSPQAQRLINEAGWQ
jgi:iron(III) transport system substrate-binding protein